MHVYENVRASSVPNFVFGRETARDLRSDGNGGGDPTLEKRLERRRLR